MNTKRNKIKKGDTMIYEEKRFMAVSEIEKECCTGCCFYDNGNCQLENPNCFNSGIIWVQKEDYMSEISEKAIKLAIEAMRPIPVYSSPCYSVIDNRSPEEKHEEDMRFCKEFNNLRSVYNFYCDNNDKDNINRKPNTGMIDQYMDYIKFINDNVDEENKIIYDTIMMIGDASGKEGQFSDSDKKTAGNFGCEYMDVDDFVYKYNNR